MIPLPIVTAKHEKEEEKRELNLFCFMQVAHLKIKNNKPDNL